MNKVRNNLRWSVIGTLLLLLAPWPGRAQTGTPSSAAAGASLPKSAAIVNHPKEIDDWDVGDIQVTYADGHTAIITHGGKCDRPHVSKKGLVGWTIWDDTTPDPNYRHSSETLRVMLPDGSVHSFKPNALYIMSWGFADDDTAVVIESMHHHGPSSFIKYKIATGEILGHVDDYVPYDQLPKWAQPYSDDKP